MTDRSTSRDQFIDEVEHIRRLKRRYWVSMIAVPIVMVVSTAIAQYVHPAFILLLVLPIASMRTYAGKLGSVKCPRCGDFYNGDPRDPKTFRWAWNVGSGSRCVNCGFPA